MALLNMVFIALTVTGCGAFYKRQVEGSSPLVVARKK